MSRKGVSVWMAIVLGLLLAWAVGVPAQDKPSKRSLSGAEMRALYDNGVIIDWEDHGSKGSAALTRHGFAFQLWLVSAGVGDMDKGRWRIDGDTICFKWQFARQAAGPVATHSGEETCWRHYHVAGNRYEARPVKEALAGGPFTLRK